MKQTEGNIIGSIVQQLMDNFPDIPTTVTDYYRAYKDGKKSPSTQDLHCMLQDLINPFHRVFIVADGLDELGSGDDISQEISMSIMEGTFKSLLDKDRGKSPKLSVLISSRFGQQLEHRVPSFQNLRISAETKELRAFIRSELETTSRLLPWVNSQLGQRIKRDLELRNQVTELCLANAGCT